MTEPTESSVVSFERERVRLSAIAYRMLGSADDAEDVVQDTWLRWHAAERESIQNLAGWLTTAVVHGCLNHLRSRRTRQDVVSSDLDVRWVESAPNTAEQVEERLGVEEGLLVLLQSLGPLERLSFVLHDSFGMPFAEIAELAGRTPSATRQAASRARRKVRQHTVHPQMIPAEHRQLVAAFFAAARDGDLAGLIKVLHPDVQLTTDGGAIAAEFTGTVRGSATVARRALTFAGTADRLRFATINGLPGAVAYVGAAPRAVFTFQVEAQFITNITSLIDSDRLNFR